MVEVPLWHSQQAVAGSPVHSLSVLLVPELSGQGPTFEDASNALRRALHKLVQHMDPRLYARLITPVKVLELRDLQIDLRGQPVRLRALVLEVAEHGLATFPALGRAPRPFDTSRPRPLWGPLLAEHAIALCREVGVQPEELSEAPEGEVDGMDLHVSPPPLDLGLQARGTTFFAGPDERRVDGLDELLRVARDLTELYPHHLRRTLVPDERVEEVARALYLTGAPLALVGPPGAGRTTLVHEAVWRSARGNHRREGADLSTGSIVWHLDPRRVIAGQSVVGAWQRRFEAILRALTKRRKPGNWPDALYVDEVIALTQVGRHEGSALSLSSVLRSHVEARRFPVVLEASPGEWRRLEELDRPFAELFRVLRVDEPPLTRATRMVLSQVERVEAATGVEVRVDAVGRLIELASRTRGEQVLPGAAVALLEHAAPRDPVDPRAPPLRVLDAAAVDALHREGTGLRPGYTDRDRRVAPAAVRQHLSDRLVGQAPVRDALAAAALRFAAGLARPGRPLGSFLFVGPTGVGKTEAARALTDLLFTRPDALVRFDMNELVDAGAPERLLGTPGEDGLLRGRLRGRSYAVVLFDEVEKGHPRVHDLLLQILDEGHVTDAAGRRIDLGGCFVVLTSNVGAGQAGRQVGFDRPAADLDAVYRAAVLQAFRPELVNRLDHVLPFHPLARDEIRRIARLVLLGALSREGFARRDLLLDVSDDAVEALVEEGFDPELGARAMKRAVEARVIAPLARELTGRPPGVACWVRVERAAQGLAMEVQGLDPALAVEPWPRLGPGALRRPLEEGRTALREAGLPELVAVAGPAGVEHPGGSARDLHDWLDTNLRWSRRNLGPAPRSRKKGAFVEPDAGPRFERGEDALADLAAVAALVGPMRARLPEPAPFEVEARLLSKSSRGVKAWLDAFQAVVGWTEGQLEGGETSPGVWRWRVRGTVPPAFVRAEAGVHLFRDPVGGMAALRVEVRDGLVASAPREVLRRYLLPHVGEPEGRVEDLRTGEDARLADLPGRLRAWMVRGAGLVPPAPAPAEPGAAPEAAPEPDAGGAP